MRHTGLLLALICTVMASSIVVPSASAQETGTLITHRATQMDGRGPNAARLTMRGFAQCIASRNPGRLQSLLAMPVGSPEATKLGDIIFTREGDDCMSGGELHFTSTIIHGSYFEAMYLQRFGRTVIDDFSTVKSSGYRDRYTQPYSAEATSAIGLEEYGECIVRKNPPAARILIGSIPGSSLETATFTEFAPVFGPCLSKGEKIAFSKTVLRGVMAEGLYWLTLAKLPVQKAAQ
ncbi:hypothetical protein BH09PSE3_BH09PSE3_09230 [soil metagenome]